MWGSSYIHVSMQDWTIICHGECIQYVSVYALLARSTCMQLILTVFIGFELLLDVPG